jgi:hypothetical protein
MMREVLDHVVAAIQRKKASWSLSVEHGRPVLAVGAPSAVKVTGGHIVVIGLNREELIRLQEAVTEALEVVPGDAGAVD